MAYKKSNPNGQATMANSEPVVIASDQGAIPASQSGTWNVTNISGTVSLPTGASTSANQTTIIGHLDGVEGLLTTIDADTSNISTKIDTLAGAVAGTEMQVDVLTMPTVTVTATNLDVQSGGADLATATQAGAIQTAVELIDDAVYTDGTGTPTKGIAVMGTDGTNPQILSTNASGHVNIADGGNSITVDGTVAVSGSVTVADGGGSLTVDNNGTFAVQATLAASTNNIGDVDVLTINGVAPAFGSGVRGATVQRVTIATDDVVPASQSGTWNITNVSGTVSLPTGASTSANQSTIIGHLDGVEALLTTIDSDTSTLALTGGGTETGALRVTIANNSTGVVSVDDNGSSLTVDGTVAATQSGTWTLGANSGVDIGDVTINNASGGSAVNIQDGGNSITVDGTITANLSATDNAVLDNIDLATTSKYITGIGHGVKTITSAGTDEALAGSTACKKVTIQAQTDNTGLIAVGGSGVDATVATGTGIILYPGDVFEFDIDNLADVFIDATVSTDGVRYTYFT